MLTPGKRIGAYEICGSLGAGGMGEVYRATDSKLKRQVALKLLPAALWGDADRLARFRREAELLASLNHPHIAAIYGFEDSGETHALVMELVEGPTLADRIAQGPIPVEEALAIAKQIAGALEAAHDRGIIHRDLKPANIKIRDDGTVKVLDFGLAKALDHQASGIGLAPSSGATNSPTLTTPAVTVAGMILGTAAYMSPEQARGRAVDQRADIWAFGCVLYEMLTGRRAFKTEDVSDALAAILRDEVDWTRLPPALPPVVRSFLMRCLAKDPRQRVSAAGDLRLALEGAFDVPAAHPATPPSPWWRRIALAALAAALTIAAFAGWLATGADTVRDIARLQLPLPPGQAFYFNGRPIVAISPDGRHVAMAAGLGLWLRSLDSLEAHSVPGAEVEARHPVFSPDSQSIVYYANGELKRASVTGGAPVTITRAVNPWGLTWGADNAILYGQGPEGIWQVSGAGGTPAQILTVEPGEIAYRPQMLPGDEWILYTLLPRGVGSWNRAQIVVQSVKTRQRTVLIDGGRDARYLPSGHIVYGLDGTLLAVGFDVRSRQLTGTAVPLVSNVFDAGTITGAVHYDIAADGTLIYVPRTDVELRLVWVDRNGREEVLPGEPRPFRHPRVSPDGTRIAVEIEEPRNTDVYVGDTKRGEFRQLTRNDDIDIDPIWTPDSSHVVFTSIRGAGGLFMQPVVGGGAARRVADATAGARALTWTAAGELGFEELQGTDLRIVPLTEGAAPRLIKMFDDPRYFNEKLPAISPDGRWVAYQSTEAGRMEVYVRPFPNMSAAQWPVSQNGGFAPLWSADGREIFYRSASSLMAVQVRTDPSFQIVSSGPLFNLAGYVLAGTRGVRYDVARDGRFLLLKSDVPGDAGSRQDVVVVQNWVDELRRRVPSR